MARLSRLGRIVRVQPARSARRRRSRAGALGYHAYRKDPGVVHAARRRPVAAARRATTRRTRARSQRSTRATSRGFDAFDREAVRLGAALFDSFADADAVVRALRRGDARDARRLGRRSRRALRRDARPASDARNRRARSAPTPVPRDAGTAYVLAHHYAGRAMGVQGAWGFVRGGMGAISAALAASAARRRARRCAPARRRTHRHARRARDAHRADRRQLRSTPRAILVNADPKTLFLACSTPTTFPRVCSTRARVWRSNGVALKLNLALGELPDFRARPGTRQQPHHRATIHVAPSIDFLQRAYDDTRTLGISREPMLECFMQTPTDPSLAPPGKHILSIFAQYFPYERADRPWEHADRDAIADAIVAAARRLRAEPSERDRAPPDPRAARPRGAAGPLGRPDLPRRTAARPDLRAPLRRAGRHRGTLHVRLGYTPRRLRQRLPRPPRRGGRHRRPRDRCPFLGSGPKPQAQAAKRLSPSKVHQDTPVNNLLTTPVPRASLRQPDDSRIRRRHRILAARSARR